MKPIIIDMEEMSDSTEVYGSRPSSILSGVIYCLCVLLIVAMIWMNFFQIDEVVRSSGMVKNNNVTATISSLASGKIAEYMMEDDTYVEVGTILLQLDTSEAEMQKDHIETELNILNNKIQILEAYLKELSGEQGVLNVQRSNPYYAQYENRLSLVRSNCAAIGLETQGVRQQYSANIKNLKSAIQRSITEEKKLAQMLECVKARKNTFETTDLYYYSTVENYINTYQTTSIKYDMDMQKEEVLGKLEQEMIASVEQSLLSAQANTTELEASMNQAETELNSINSGQEDLSKEQVVENEISTVYSELNTYISQKKEYEKSLQSLAYTIEQSTVVAQRSGFLNLFQENAIGDYIAGGTQLGSIVPVGDGIYKIQIYLDNQDIGKLQEGASVKYEIGAYPSSEYGQATGTITKVSEDLKINQDTGKGYYLAEATIVLPESNSEMVLKQGMAVEAKVIVGQKSVMNFLLEKLDLLIDIS